MLSVNVKYFFCKSHPSRLVLTFRSVQWAAYKLHQGLEKGFKAHKYFRDYEEDHGHDLWRMIPQVAEIRRLAEPLVVSIKFRIQSLDNTLQRSICNYRVISAIM